MRNEQILVTGGTGFIGSLLVRRLVQENYSVRVVCRRSQGREPLATVSFWHGDVTSLDTLRSAIQGCTLVFHCAACGGALDDARKVNVEGTRNVMLAAAEAGVHRVIHLSSIAVYGRVLPHEVSDDQVHCPGGDPYAISKSEGERIVFDLGRQHSIPVVVLRPTLVYGPASPTWTIWFFQRVKYAQIVLPNLGRGRANLVYVSDLVDAMLLAATMPNVSGQAFNINGSDLPTWAEYLGCFSQMLGKPLPPALSRWRAHLEAQKNIWSFRFTRRPSRLTPSDLTLMNMESVFNACKAENMLGYRPRVNLKEGMGYTEAWLRQTGHLAI